MPSKLMDHGALPGREPVVREGVCLIHADELAWIRAEGPQVLLDAFAEHGYVPLLVNPERPSLAP